MRFQFVQAVDPEKTEASLTNLRKQYANNPLFKHLWDKFVSLGAKAMQLDARFQPFGNTMDICLIFRKKKKK
jgi:hypothetical protein